ncbi:MAG: kinase/pyrophosphorylase, partial [Pseudomonadota bacterium]
DAFVDQLESELETKASHAAGRAHGMSDADTYMKRIEATNYALANDDGGVTRNYDQADVILVGVSRSGKTPTCLYLALQYGVYAANYPITDDEFEGGTLPARLLEHRNKLFGLTINARRLQQIRKERRSAGRYASAQQVNFELRAAAALFSKYRIPHVDTTGFSIEEISSRILEATGVERRVRP